MQPLIAAWNFHSLWCSWEKKLSLLFSQYLWTWSQSHGHNFLFVLINRNMKSKSLSETNGAARTCLLLPSFIAFFKFVFDSWFYFISFVCVGAWWWCGSYVLRLTIWITAPGEYAMYFNNVFKIFSVSFNLMYLFMMYLFMIHSYFLLNTLHIIFILI